MSSRTNPMVITTSTTGLIGVSTELYISGVGVFASNATWSASLTDASGDLKWKADNVAGVPPTPAVPFRTTGLNATVSSCELYIYTVPS